MSGKQGLGDTRAPHYNPSVAPRCAQQRQRSLPGRYEATGTELEECGGIVQL